MVKLYTKTGDQGYTSLIGGQRTPKNHPRIAAYGDVDELIAHTAHLHDSLEGEEVLEELRGELLQTIEELMLLSAHLACGDGHQAKLPPFGQQEVERLEHRIDAHTTELPAIRSFTLPGGESRSSLAHIARTVCRRCERSVVDLEDNEIISPALKIYLNRLSDYFYVLSRLILCRLKIKEMLWRHGN